jgi:hypothetical protein
MNTEPIDYTLDLSTIVPDLVKGLLENLPEAGICLTCTGWDYKKMEFTIVDEEEGKTYELTLDMAERAFMKLLREMLAGEGASKTGLVVGEMLDESNWDGPAIDSLVQMAVLGEVIYG